MRYLVIFILAFSIHMLYAQDKKTQTIVSEQTNPSFFENYRQYLIQWIGIEWTDKILGKESDVVLRAKEEKKIVMPKLPEIKLDAKSTAIYNKKTDKVVIKKEIEQKYFYNFALEVFEATRMAKPTNEDIQPLMNVLEQGGAREGVYHSLVLDNYYSQKENEQIPLSDGVKNFALYFYKKYIGKELKAESIATMNVFTVKRLVAEKALEMMDSFGEDREGVENWYTIMSSDIATKFPMIWDNKMRKDTSLLKHKMWAHRVPLQHIKSEMLIKIHIAFNSLK